MFMKQTKIASSLLFFASVVSHSAFAAPSNLPMTTIFYGGPIITMENDQPTAEAVVTSQYGKIVYVGSEQEALKQYPDSKKIDLDDKVLMPGFIEQHLHPFLGALTLNMPVIAPEEWQLPTKTWPAVTNHDDYIAALIVQEKALKDPNETLWTWGFNNYFHGELSRQQLDKISKTRPIGVWHRSAHEFYVNSAFIKKYNLNQMDVDKLGKEVAGQVNLDKGHFLEGGALIYLLPRIAQDLGNEQRFTAGLKQLVTMLHQKG